MAGLRHPGIGLRPSGGGERVLGEVSEKGSCLWPLASADRLSRLSLLSHQSRRVSMSENRRPDGGLINCGTWEYKVPSGQDIPARS
eukprot:s1744_g15.t1